MISIFANDVIFLKEANGVVSLKANHVISVRVQMVLFL